jgi:hypothetical protein
MNPFGQKSKVMSKTDVETRNFERFAALDPYEEQVWKEEPYTANFSDPSAIRPRRELRNLTLAPSMIGTGYLTKLLQHGQTVMQAVANLGVGAAIVPDGLAIMSSDHIYLPFALMLTPPHWVPVRLRTPDWKAACNGAPPQCKRIIDPIMAQQDCPSTEYLQEATATIAEEFARQYTGAVNPKYYAQLLQEFCVSNAGLCTRSDLDEMSHEHLRHRRFVITGMILGGAALIAAFTALGLGIANRVELKMLQNKVNAVEEMVDRLAGAMLIVEKSMTELASNGEKVSRMITEGLTEVYTLVEKLRCADFRELESLQQYTAMQIYKQYLAHTFDAIYQTASTGKVTPELIGVTLPLNGIWVHLTDTKSG